MQLLGLRGRDSYLDPQILAAYEALAAEPIEEGFSQRASDGRTLLLEEVFQDLRRSKGRNSIQSKGIDVEWNLLPGALALLQEVGSCSGSAVSIGLHGSPSGTQDVQAHSCRPEQGSQALLPSH